MNEKSSGSRSRKQRLTAVGTRCADHVTPLYPHKLTLTSPTGGGRSVGTVRVRTKATDKKLLDATYCFIILMIGSTCFGHYYAHHQELAAIVLITTWAVPFLSCCWLEVRCRQAG